MRKILVSLVGGILALLGVVLFIVPGPAWLFLPAGLAVLSLEYPWAERWLKVCMAKFRQSAAWLDRKLLARKYR